MSHAAPQPAEPARAPLPQWWWDQTLRTRRIIAGCVLVLLVAGVGTAVYALTDGDGDNPVDAEAQLFVATLSPTRVATWDDLAQCESEGDWGAATGNGFYGGLQISQTTWLEFGGGDDGPHLASREEQIMRAESIYDGQGWGAWPSCSSQLGLQN